MQCTADCGLSCNTHAWQPNGCDILNLDEMRNIGQKGKMHKSEEENTADKRKMGKYRKWMT